MLRSFAGMCETFIFLYLGLGIFAFGSDKVTYNFGMIIFALVKPETLFCVSSEAFRFFFLWRKQNKKFSVAHYFFWEGNFPLFTFKNLPLPFQLYDGTVGGNINLQKSRVFDLWLL